MCPSLCLSLRAAAGAAVVTDCGLKAVASSCSQLDSLALFRCYSCGDASLTELVRSGRTITSLVLHNCPQVSATGVFRVRTSQQEDDRAGELGEFQGDQ